MAKSLLFVDRRVSDYAKLLGGLPAGAEIYLLDPDRDGITQMADYLAGRSGFDSIQIISHGSSGALNLGSTVLDGTNLLSYQQQLDRLGRALTATGDILLYGCNVAHGESGRDFINQLAKLTGADVAASTDPTGAAKQGGNWSFEVSTGSVETAGISVPGYHGLLGLTISPLPHFYPGASIHEYANLGAFAALRADGSVVTWGSVDYGGNSSAVATELNGSIDVTQVFSSSGAFAALRADRSVVTWGRASSGGNSSTVAEALNGSIDVTQVFSTYNAFAALRADGSVITWGDAAYGGASSAVAAALNGSIDITQVFSTKRAFAALKDDGSVVTWGDAAYGGDDSSVLAELDGSIDVTQVFPNIYAFAALRADGSVVTWGNAAYGGNSTAVAAELNGSIDVKQIVSTALSYAALRADGSVVTWGEDNYGGTGSSTMAELDGAIEITQLFATKGAFAALRADGSVVTWGESTMGGDSSAVAAALDGNSKVTQVFSTGWAFAALRADGSVVTWGYAANGGISNIVAAKLDGSIDVTQIYSNEFAFAALRADGSVVTWGETSSGGSSGSVAAKLDGSIDVTRVVSTEYAFAALRADGSVVTWGHPDYGGNSNSVSEQLSNVVSLANPYANDVYFNGVADTTPPTVTSFSPTDEASGVAVGSNIVVTFNETIQRGTGDIVITTADGVPMATYPTADSINLTISGNVLTIDPTVDLAYGTGYQVGLTSGAIKDLAGNSYSGTASYNFTTAAHVDTGMLGLTITPLHRSYPCASGGEHGNDFAFAALQADGSVVTWGDDSFGGNSSRLTTALNGSNDVMQVYSTRYAFAALRADGSVVAWGDGDWGGDSSSVAAAINGRIDVTQVFSTGTSFAALRADGSVVTWGWAGAGGDSSSVATALNGSIDVTQVFSTSNAFAALRDDGSVVTWGGAGGDSSSVAAALNGNNDVIQVCSTGSAFAALRADGSVVTWGGAGGDSSSVATALNGSNDVVKVFSTFDAFAALRADGSVVTWGDSSSGGDSSSVATELTGGIDVTQVVSSWTAFAALRTDGSVVTWGNFESPAIDISSVAMALNSSTYVMQVFSTGDAFAALRADGSVVTWGRASFGGDSSSVVAALNGSIDVTQVFSTYGAFAALRADGSVVTWGDSAWGGDSSSVAAKLDGSIDVTQVFSTGSAFAALRADGTVVTWGNATHGGDSSSVASQMTNVVSMANPFTNDVYFVPDTTPPTVTGFRPVDDASGVEVDSNLVVIFNEAIQLGNGSITLKTAIDVTVATYNAAGSSNLAIYGNTLTINPSDDLAYSTSYHVEFATGTIKDLAGNSLAGTTSDNFTTLAPGDNRLLGLTVTPLPHSYYPGASSGEHGNSNAFAALRVDGSVVTWGYYSPFGGDYSSVVATLNGNNDVTQVFSAWNAFAALRVDGSVVTWGYAELGGDSSSVASALNGTIDVKQVFSTGEAFAALRADGSVVTWGWAGAGGDSSSVASALNGSIDVTQVFSNESVFAALRADGSVVTWGDAARGGDSSSVALALNGSIDVTQVCSTKFAFAALRADGSVVTWGNNDGGGDSSSVASALNGNIDVTQVFSTSEAFAALRADGTLVTWGDSLWGGGSSNLATELMGSIAVTQVVSTEGAFAALRVDGSVVTWGNGFSYFPYGDSVVASLNGSTYVMQLFSTSKAFAALQADGSVVTWGSADAGGDSSSVAAALDGSIDVTQVFSTDSAFAALRADGSVVTWGNAGAGGDSSSVTTALNGNINVTNIFSTSGAFAALRADGTVVTWGSADGGGNSSSVAGQLTNVVSMANPYSNDVYLAPDTTPPTVTAFTPADAETGVAIDSNIVVIFNEEIQRGTGNIVIKTAAGATVATYNATTSANLSFSGDMLTINPSADLAYDTPYNVEFASGTIKDLAGNSYGGTTSYDFTTGPAPDTTAPTVISFNPLDEAIGVATNSNIVVIFSEAVQRGTGSIILKTADGSTVASYNAAASSNLSVSGSTLTINPTDDLASSTGYSVEFAAGSIKDLAGNSYAGSISYNFTAADIIAPTITSFSPADEAIGVAVASNIVVTFSEAIQRGTGNIVLKTGAGATVATYNAVTSGNLNISGNTLTIDPSADFASGTAYTVEFGVGTIKDLAGNSYAGTTNYNFTVADIIAPAAPIINTVATDNIINAIEQNNVINGSNETGATVTLSIGGNSRSATVSGTTWNYTLVAADIAAMGQGAETLSATQADAAGNTSSAGVRAITVDTVSPAAPTINAFATDNVINASEQTSTITGSNEAGATVALNIGGNSRAATVNGTTWSYALVADDLTAIGQGSVTISATQTDAAGNTSVVGTRAITVDTIAPSAPTINAVATDDLINASEQTSTITGSNEDGATVALSIGGNNREATVNGATWSYTQVAADLAAMGQGIETLSATQTDAVGNTSGAGTRNITVDTIAPTASFSPSDEATGVAVNSDIVATFSEAIQRGTGNIVLKTAAGTTVATYDAATSTNLVLSGNTLTINPSADLASGTGYTVEFVAGTIQDLAANNYGGTMTYNFTTAAPLDTTAPVAPKLVTNAAFNFLVDPQVTMQTSMGTVVLELHPEQAPITVANMLAYANSGFYDNTLFHRVIPNFMAQGGGFTTGLVYKTPTYNPIVLESNNGLSNLRGTIAMARTSVANSATSQFFVNQVDNTYLNYSSASSPGYAVFGQVVSGLAVIDSIVQVPTKTVSPYANVPVTEVTITSLQQTLAGSSITNTATLTVSDLENGAQWSYSLDDGATWTTGSGNSFAVPVGNYAAGAIEVRQSDAAGNLSSSGTLSSSLVVETTAPTVTGFSPADEATGVTIDGNIVVTFNETIQRGSGNILLKTVAGVIVATYNAASSSNLAITGNTLTINPTADLLPASGYTVEFAAGAIKDLAGNSYAGTSTYNFTTAAYSTYPGTVGNDTFSGGVNNDLMNGGAGLDNAIFAGNRQGYTITPSGSGCTLSGEGWGTDTLTSVERLHFADVNLAWDIDGSAGQVYRLYQAAFDRTPDLSGLGGWIGGMDGGMTLLQVAAAFVGSAEFQSLYGANPSNEQFITQLYLNVLNRAPDEGGFGYWVDQLARSLQSRAEVLVFFSESGENQAAVLPAIGGGILYASAEQAAGLARGQNFEGSILVDILIGTVGNDTFFGGGGDDSFDGGVGIDSAIYEGSRAGHTITRTSGGLTVSGGSDGTDTLVNVERLKFADSALAFDIAGNAGQTYRLYQAAFARTPDTAGLSDWIRGMDSGMTLQNVATGFIGSAEFQGLYGASPTNTEFIDLLYNNVLHRAPDQAGYDYWIDQINHGMSREQVLVGFSESQENQLALLGVIQDGIDYIPA